MKSTGMGVAVVMAVWGMMAGESFGLFYSGGGTYSLHSEISEVVWIDWSAPGKQSTFSVEPGGSVIGEWNVDGYQDSRIVLNGGLLSWNLLAHDRSEVTLNSGTITKDLIACDDSVVNILGGTIGGKIDLRDRAKLTFFGSDFVLGATPVQYGQLSSIPVGSTTLTGTFENGQTISYQLLAGNGTAVYLMIPEPATFGVLALGGWILLKKRQGRHSS